MSLQTQSPDFLRVTEKSRRSFQYYMYARARFPVQHGLHMAFGHTKTSLVLFFRDRVSSPSWWQSYEKVGRNTKQTRTFLGAAPLFFVGDAKITLFFWKNRVSGCQNTDAQRVCTLSPRVTRVTGGCQESDGKEDGSIREEALRKGRRAATAQRPDSRENSATNDCLVADNHHTTRFCQHHARVYHHHCSRLSPSCHPCHPGWQSANPLCIGILSAWHPKS